MPSTVPLSVVAASLSGMHRHHPWRALRSLTDWTLHWRDLGDEVLGETDHHRRTVTLTTGMTQAQRRSTIAHEVAHIERGPVPAFLEPREEVAVDVVAARRLISWPDLLDACRWARTLEELADELWVDEATAECRLRHLHPSEQTKLMEVWADDSRAHGH